MWRSPRDKRRVGYRVLLALSVLMLVVAQSSILAVTTGDDPTTGSLPAIRLNEVAAVALLDDVEWIELANLGDVSVSLQGWSLDDFEGAGAPPIFFAVGAEIGAHQLLRVNTPNMFNDRGSEAVRLVAPDVLI